LTSVSSSAHPYPTTATNTVKIQPLPRKALREKAKEMLSERHGSPPLSPEESNRLLSYCLEVRDSSTWGGHVELLALCRVFGMKAEIISANSTTEINGEEDETGNPAVSPLLPLASKGKEGEEVTKTGLPSIRICFLEHAYGLGEHYNSTEPLATAAGDA